MLVVRRAIRIDGETVTVAFGDNLNSRRGFGYAIQQTDRRNLYLHLYIGIHRDVKDGTVAGKPGVGPATYVADANGSDRVDRRWQFHGRATQTLTVARSLAQCDIQRHHYRKPEHGSGRGGVRVFAHL